MAELPVRCDQCGGEVTVRRLKTRWRGLLIMASSVAVGGSVALVFPFLGAGIVLLLAFLGVIDIVRDETIYECGDCGVSWRMINSVRIFLPRRT